jgi:ABC-type dipeptide/oligopeptide/nickel transport system permease component
MLRYVIRRLLLLIPMIFAASVVIFLLLRMGAGDPALDYLRLSNLPPTQEMVASTRIMLGLDKPCRSSICTGCGRRCISISVSRMRPSARCWRMFCTSCPPHYNWRASR